MKYNDGGKNEKVNEIKRERKKHERKTRWSQPEKWVFGKSCQCSGVIRAAGEREAPGDTIQGVNHGGDFPPEFGVGDASANCHPQILSCFKISSTRLLKASAHRYKKSVLRPSKYAKKRFRPGLCPRPRWGAHDAP